MVPSVGESSVLTSGVVGEVGEDEQGSASDRSEDSSHLPANLQLESQKLPARNQATARGG